MTQLTDEIDALTINGHGNNGNLSKRGLADLKVAEGPLKKFEEIMGQGFDARDNPNGIVLFSIADNSLLRAELIRFFTAPGRLTLEPRNMTYADGFFASKRVVEQVATFYNTTPDGLYTEQTWTPPLTPVRAKHIVFGNGATQIIEAVFWELLDENDGVLIQAPYYNAFDDDLALRAKVKIVPVSTDLPRAANAESVQGMDSSFAAEACIEQHERALEEAKRNNINVRALLVCNPHNPTGGIYPRQTMVALAKFAQKHSLHLVVDEIYARSVFVTSDVAEPTPFDSILRIDTLKEAGLDPSRVHVISSASKDFGINGFRFGIFISQHNPQLIDAMFANVRFSQIASPAGQLFASLLKDTKYLTWYLHENQKRLAQSYGWVTSFFNHHSIPYVASNAGHFLMIDLRRFLAKGSGGDDARQQEQDLSAKLLKHRIFIAPGGMYHHPVPGFFRFTFSIEVTGLRVGLARIEKALGLEGWIDSQPAWKY